MEVEVKSENISPSTVATGAKVEKRSKSVDRCDFIIFLAF